MTTPTLKPCPNPGCGGETFIDSLWKVVERWRGYRGACAGCGMLGAFAPSPEAAATLWNSLPRTPEPQGLPTGKLPEGVTLDRCKHCGGEAALMGSMDAGTIVCIGCGLGFDRLGAACPVENQIKAWNRRSERTPEVEWLPEGEVPKGSLGAKHYEWQPARPEFGVYAGDPAAAWYSAQVEGKRWSRHPIPMPPAPGEES